MSIIRMGSEGLQIGRIAKQSQLLEQIVAAGGMGVAAQGAGTEVRLRLNVRES